MIILILAIIVVVQWIVIRNLRASHAGHSSHAVSEEKGQAISGDVDLNDRLRQLLREGQKIKAIKELRTVHRISLAEAKQYVDQLERNG
ncbi:hypothetical protein ACI2JA_01300 [Alkalihalobacillus sp. NPDC078783]